MNLKNHTLYLPSRPFHFKVRTKLAVLISVLLAVISLFIFLYFPMKQEAQALELIDQRSQTLVQMIASHIAPALHVNDRGRIEQAFDIAEANRDLIHISVYDNSGQELFSRMLITGEQSPLASAERFQAPPSKDLHNAAAPIVYNGSMIGHLHIGLSLHSLQNDLAKTRLMISVISLLIFLLGITVTFGISTAITRPLSHMVNTVELIAGGDLSQRAKIHSQDEIGYLAESFNIMVGSLESTHHQLQDTLATLKRRAEELQNEMAEREKAERNSARAQALAEAAEASNKTKSEFLANLSHELRTPMTGIIGATELLVKAEEKDSRQEFAEIIKQSSNSMMVLINDLLDIARIEAGKMALNFMEFNLAEALDSFLKPLELKADEKNLTLTLHVHPSVDANYIGDIEKIGQILNNLVGNAIKFTSEGFVELNVSNREQNFPQQQAFSDRAYLHFQIQDTGIGIPEEQLETVFNSFTQADGSMTRKYGGTGLGLTISKHLIELMDGQIWIESSQDMGSTFHFTVLLDRIEAATDRPAAAATGPAIHNSRKTSSLERTQQAGPCLRILLAEDNVINQKLIVRLLERRDYTVVIANNGKEALLASEKEQFDLILMDIQMPEMNGLETTLTIRKREKGTTRHIPIIALTAHAQDVDKKRCFEAGMDAYVSKPIDPEGLVETIKLTMEQLVSS